VGRRVALLVAAIVIAAIGTTLVYLYAKQADDRAQADAQPVDVLVAKELIPAGTSADQALTDNLIETKSIASADVAPNAVGDVQAISGQVAVTTIYPGQQLLTDLFGETVEAVSSIDNLPEGMIASSYTFSDTGRVAGFVNPGSKVAVFLTSPSADPGDEGRETTRLLLPNVEVLAVANVTANPPADPTKANPEELPRALMTLALTQPQTEKMKLAVTLGELSLGLRNDNSEVVPGPGVNVDNLFN
jgi:pilus assembly protein CpaB